MYLAFASVYYLLYAHDHAIRVSLGSLVFLGSVSSFQGYLGPNKTLYKRHRFKSPRMSEEAALSRVLFMGVKCTTSNEREAMKCFRKKLNFLGILIVHEK